MSKDGNIFLRRYLPICRSYGSFIEQEQTKIIVDNFGKSITDKEAYRLSLINGVGASASGAVNPACYMFPDGQYDINKDISYVLRPDLSPVQIDDYLSAMKDSLEAADDKLKSKIEKDIQYAEEIKKRSESQSNEDSVE